MKTIALIPARGGSKRIPHKNIKHFLGKPIITYSIALALESALFDDVIVSTDSMQIADIARECGASVPFMRPAHLSDDVATTSLVAAHAAEILKLKDNDLLCVIYPTAPLLRAETLIKALDILHNDATKCFSFCAVRYDYNPLRSFYIRENGLDMLFSEQYLARSQDLEPIFHDAGQFYWGRAHAWRDNLPIFAKHSSAVIVPPHCAQDIDTMEDWAMAEMKYKMAFGLP